MSEYTQIAIESLDEALLEHSKGDHERGDRLTAQAMASAQIAIAEELKIMADAMARISGDNYLRTYEMNKSP